MNPDWGMSHLYVEKTTKQSLKGRKVGKFQIIWDILSNDPQILNDQIVYGRLNMIRHSNRDDTGKPNLALRFIWEYNCILQHFVNFHLNLRTSNYDDRAQVNWILSLIPPWFKIKNQTPPRQKSENSNSSPKPFLPRHFEKWHPPPPPPDP